MLKSTYHTCLTALNLNEKENRCLYFRSLTRTQKARIISLYYQCLLDPIICNK